MIVGTLVLGGEQIAEPLPITPMDTGPEVHELDGNIKASRCGTWRIFTDLPKKVLLIPSRDKRVEVFASSPLLAADLETIDSDHGPNYRTKLLQVMDGLPSDLMGVVLNESTSTHSSIALVAGSDLHLYGLYDTQRQQAHLLWTTDPQVMLELLARSPLRYLVYRFPILFQNCVFLQIETICSKWYRWTKSGQALQAFNALEQRLYSRIGA